MVSQQLNRQARVFHLIILFFQFLSGGSFLPEKKKLIQLQRPSESVGPNRLRAGISASTNRRIESANYMPANTWSILTFPSCRSDQEFAIFRNPVTIIAAW